MESNPAVSVIVPLYNAEKYIAELLESVLAQTLQNFEVIVVDDCSTDNGVEIVESYVPKFGGRLKLYQTDKNSGSGAVPRNRGMELSRGEYLFFIDDDDLITPTALEELYTLAKDFDADVVYCENNYVLSPDGSGLYTRLGKEDLLVDKPTFEPENLAERVKRILMEKYYQPQWVKLVRRNLIFEHDLFFLSIRHGDDTIWTYGLIFYAKKFLRVPNMTHIRRLTKISIMRKERTPQETIKFWLNPALLGVKTLDNLMSKHVFFQKNPQYRYAILEKFFLGKFNMIFNESCQITPVEFYEAVREEFGKNFGEYDVAISLLCSSFNMQQRTSLNNLQEFNKFIEQNKKRIAELENELNRRR